MNKIKFDPARPLNQTRSMPSQFKQSAINNYAILFAPIAMGFIIVLVMALSKLANRESLFFYIGISAMLAGYALLVNSKWGITNEGMRGQYKISYAIMITGWLIACFSGLLSLAFKI